MKKTAVLIYDAFCHFEISVALETLALHNKSIDVFAKKRELVKSEEGFKIFPDKTIYECDLEEYDSLLLPGATDIRHVVEDMEMIEFIKKFRGKVIGAISIAPILLVKAGMLSGKAFMIGATKESLLEEGYTNTDLQYMKDWNECIQNPIAEGYIVDENIVTSVSFEFVKFGIQFCKMLDIEISPRSFGLSDRN